MTISLVSLKINRPLSGTNAVQKPDVRNPERRQAAANLNLTGV